MSPYLYVKDIILEYRANHTWAQTVTAAGVSRNTLVDIVEGKETGYHEKLILIVHGLCGLQKRNEFVIKFRNYSSIFLNMASFVDYFDSKADIIYPTKYDLLKPKVLEILMYTGCDHGIAIDSLHNLLPHRKDLIKSLLDREVITKKKGRYYSFMENSDPSFSFELIKTKLAVKLDTAIEDASLSSVFYGEDSFTKEGVLEFVELVELVKKRFYEIKKKHSIPDGIVLSCNSFITTLGLDQDTRKDILSSQENKDA